MAGSGQGCETRFSQPTFSVLCFVMCDVGDFVRLLVLWLLVCCCCLVFNDCWVSVV